MSNVTPRLLLLSLVIMCIGSVGGWAITDNVASRDDSYEFAYGSIFAICLILLLQVSLYILGRERLYFKVLFGASFSMSMIWFMMCLVLPLAWADNVDVYMRALMFALIVPLSLGNIAEAFRRFSVKWAKNGSISFEKAFNRDQGSVEWEQVTKSLNLEGVIYIPGFPRKLTSVVAILIVPCMLIGLALRNVYPEVSLFAWGIPSILIVAFFVQLIGYGLAQAKIVLELEAKNGQKFR
ncbi:hypothetical protein [Pseudoduganella umbonata]|uniref:Uncharacterized protein n=1 Tax=Pseudoduganella umbonata TaxID=864828 RepID=A0A4P8HUX4_9BURK|nr:hypothetical protein [Pseudoduganella umbonata]MBB3222144.1 hypothetical protein [Pseudoduganella umbonata]QCP12380.1 hypothetical protein FCL38_19615 [Pseudoduganella umbonata]